MKKETYESLGAFQKLIYDFIKKSFQKGEYEIKKESDYYDEDGYVRCYLILGGYSFECSVNKDGFICWHCEKQIEKLIKNETIITDTICKEVDEYIKSSAISETDALIKDKERKIAELKAELKRLKG